MELISDAEAAAAFINGIVPQDILPAQAANLEVVKPAPEDGNANLMSALETK